MQTDSIKEEIKKEEIKDIIFNIKNNFRDNKNITIRNDRIRNWGWWLFDYKKHNNVIEFWYSLEKWELANIWIDSKNIDLISKIENSNKEYWEKYSDNFWKTTIIPKDSQNLYKKSEKDIIEILNNYIAIIEKQTN